MNFKLDIGQTADNFFDQCQLIGIVAPIKQYSFVWHINQKLGLQMRLNNDLEIPLRKKIRNYYFSVFEYKVPGSVLTYYLYNNKNEGEYLLPEFKHLDFLWLNKYDTLSEASLNELVLNLRQLPLVQMAVPIKHELLKNRDYLIL